MLFVVFKKIKKAILYERYNLTVCKNTEKEKNRFYWNDFFCKVIFKNNCNDVCLMIAVNVMFYKDNVEQKCWHLSQW